MVMQTFSNQVGAYKSNNSATLTTIEADIVFAVMDFLTHASSLSQISACDLLLGEKDIHHFKTVFIENQRALPAGRGLIDKSNPLNHPGEISY